MKRYTDLGDEERDLLLFEYLEGQLSDKQTRELEAQLAADPTLQMELEHWKEAFLTPGFPNTEPLEKRLLKPNLAFVHSITAFILALFTLLICLLPFSTPEQTPLLPIASKPAIPATIDRIKAMRFEQKQLATEKEPPALASIPQPIRAERVEVPLPSLKAVDYELLKPMPLALEGNPGVADLNLPQVRIVPIPVPTPKKVLTRKQKRQIVKMKGKAIERKKANEFLKGNEPYVVPLNKESF